MSNSKYIIEITEDNFNSEVLERSRSVPVLVDFWAEWCQPCKMLMPLLAELAEQYKGGFVLGKLNTEKQQGLAAAFGIRSIPTVKLFRNGEPVDEFMGALPESEIRAFLDRHVQRDSDRLLARAEDLIRQEQAEEALRLIEQAVTDDPENPRTHLALARVRAILGDIDGAEEALATLPAGRQEEPDVRALRARFLFDRVADAAPDTETLERRLEQDPANSEAIYQLAARKVMDGDQETALELLLRLVQTDRKYGDDAGRKAMLALFEIMGGGGELVNRYRSRMFNALH